MPRPLILWTSDWHLAPGAWKKAPQIRGDSYFALEQIVDLALQFGVKAVCCAGDLTDDPRPDAETVKVMRHQLDRLEESGKKVPFIRGQHDGLTGPPWLSAVHDGPHYCHRGTAEIAGVQVYGLDYMPPDEFRRALDEVEPGTDVLMTHQVWKDWIPWRNNAPLLEELVLCGPKARFCVTGDFHHHLAVNRGEVTILSPGSACMQALDEPPEKRVWLMYDDLSVQSVPLLSRPFHSITVETPEDLERAVADVSPYMDMYCRTPGDLPEGVRVPIVRVRYADNLPEADARLRAAFVRVHAFVEPYPSTQQVVEVGRDDKNDAAVHTALERLAPAGTVVHRDLTELMDAPNAGAALTNIRERFYREAVGED